MDIERASDRLRPRSLAAAVALVAAALVSPGTTATGEQTDPPEHPMHRIAVRQVDGDGEFYDTVTGRRFQWRGAAILRYAVQVRDDGTIGPDHATFDVPYDDPPAGACFYDPAEMELFLTQLQSSGYNVVRVWLNRNQLNNFQGDPSHRLPGVNPAYIANLKDFIVRAKAHNVYVYIHHTRYLPRNWCRPLPPDEQWLQGTSQNILTLSRTFIDARVQLYQDVIAEMLLQGTPMDAVIGWDAHAEIAFKDLPPFSWSDEQVVTAPNGLQYVMPTQRMELLHDATVYFADTLEVALHEVHPDALVGMSTWNDGVTPPGEVGPDHTIPVHPSWIDETTVDFNEYHVHTADRTVADHMWGGSGTSSKPRMMGEFGVHKPSFPTRLAAQSIARQRVRESCSFRFDGWLHYYWGDGLSPYVPDHAWWETVEEFEEGGTLNDVLAPVVWPRPCVIVQGP